jgi:hypothetical protein
MRPSQREFLLRQEELTNEMRLIDSFYDNQYKLGLDHPFPKPDGVVQIHNIAQYAEETGWNWSPGALNALSLRRPFELTWFEFSLPPNNLCGRTAAILSQECQLGVDLLESTDFYITENEKSRVIGIGRERYDTKGKYIPRDGNKISVVQLPYSPSLTDFGIHIFYEISEVFMTLLTITLLFLHCRNVKLIESKLLSMEVKRRRQEHRNYFEKFYTLKIDTMKRILDTKGHAQTKGLRYAFHICRGNFKTYDGKGIFGKYPGTYFFSPHVRGSKSIGKIFKDYEICLPEKIREEGNNGDVS